MIVPDTLKNARNLRIACYLLMMVPWLDSTLHFHHHLTALKNVSTMQTLYSMCEINLMISLAVLTALCVLVVRESVAKN